MAVDALEFVFAVALEAMERGGGGGEGFFSHLIGGFLFGGGGGFRFFGGGLGFGFFGFGSGVAFGGGLVIFAPVIGDIKAGAFEDEACAGAEEAFNFSFAPSFLLAEIFGASGEDGVLHGLINLEGFLTLFALVIVGGHGVLALVLGLMDGIVLAEGKRSRKG